tara:strand:- start:130 stop:540 length:411 start_codon:yes stop_codon:yes gene_type:complete
MRTEKEWCGSYECGEVCRCKKKVSSRTKRREWFDNRTDSELEEIEDWMNSRHKLKASEAKCERLRESEEDIQAQKANLLSQGRLLIKAREECEGYKYDLDILVSLIHDCVHNTSQDECYDILKEIDIHYTKLKEQG